MSTVSTNKTDSKKVLLVFGPTAVGKTDLLVELFSGKGEVISADSLQAYRGLDIGTAKPDKAVQEALPHHLIDIRDPHERYNAGEFVAAADELIADIWSRNRVPIVSGGTPFYLRNFVYGLPQTPPSDPAVRVAIDLEVQNDGIEAAYRRLQEIDPETANRLSPRDTYRIKRALEVYRLSGKKLSCHSVSYNRRKEFDMLLIGLDRPRDELHRRIEKRVGLMFRLGLVSEVASLVSAGHDETAPAMQGIGYREFFEMRRVGCTTLADVRDGIVTHTRKFSKRQMTFFNRFPDTAWFHPAEKKAVLSRVKEFLPRHL